MAKTSLERLVADSFLTYLKRSVYSDVDKALFVHKRDKGKARNKRCWVSATEGEEQPPQSGNYHVEAVVTFRVNAFKDGEDLETFYASGLEALKGRLKGQDVKLTAELSKQLGLHVYGILRNQPGETRSVAGGHHEEKETILIIACGQHDK